MAYLVFHRLKRNISNLYESVCTLMDKLYFPPSRKRYEMHYEFIKYRSFVALAVTIPGLSMSMIWVTSHTEGKDRKQIWHSNIL